MDLLILSGNNYSVLSIISEIKYFHTLEYKTIDD